MNGYSFAMVYILNGYITLYFTGPAVKAQLFAWKSDRLDHIFYGLVLERRDVNVFCYPFKHLFVHGRRRVEILAYVFHVFTFDCVNGPPCREFMYGSRREIEFAREHERRACGSHVDFFCTVFPQFLNSEIF